MVGHEEPPELHEEIEGVVGHERTVLDAVDAGVERGPDAVIAVGVGGNPESGAVSLVHDGPQLLVGVLLGSGRTGV